jgi:uncharacterized protein (DUF3820 family)
MDRNLTMNSIKNPVPKARTLTPIKRPTLTPVKKPVENTSYRDLKMPFGKHKGELLADIPNSYLDWLLEQDFFEEKFREQWLMTKKELDYRKKFNIYMR